MIVGDGQGIWKTRSVHRKPLGDRWDPKTIELVRFPPWRTSDDDPNMDGELPAVIQIPVQRKEVQEELVNPRRTYLSKEDFEKLGYSGKCPGCRSILKGTARQGHSEECRKRMEKELVGTDKVDRTRYRESKFFENVLERDDKRRKEQARDLLSGPLRDEGDAPMVEDAGADKVEDDTVEMKDELKRPR